MRFRVRNPVHPGPSLGAGPGLVPNQSSSDRAHGHPHAGRPADARGHPRGEPRAAGGRAEREHILRALEESNWNVSGAARTLGMERTNLHKRIRALGLARGK